MITLKKITSISRNILSLKNLHFRILSLLLIVCLVFPSYLPVFAAGSKTINLTALNNDQYPTEFYFSNTKILELSVALNDQTEANETIEIDINNYLIYDSLTNTSAMTYLTKAPTVASITPVNAGDTAKRITLNLKQGMSGSFTMPITAHFNSYNSWHGDTATITITQKQNGVVVGTPQTFTYTLYNDSKPDIFLSKSTAVVPGGSVTYNLYYRTGRKQRGETNYTYSSINTGIKYSGTTTIPLPSIGVENVEIINPVSGIYDSVNNVVKITASGFLDNPVLQFKVKYSDSLVQGSTFTADNPTFTGTTALGKSLDTSDLKATIAPISETVGAKPTPKITFTILNPGSNDFLIGENANTQYTEAQAAGKGHLFGFAFNNNSPYDFNNVEVVMPVPDGMKATGFKVPNNNNSAYSWLSTHLIQVEYTKNDDEVVTKNVTPNNEMQFFTATDLGLGANEYIKSFKFKFDKIGSAELNYAHTSPYTINFYILGYVDTKYKNGSDIQDGDKLNIAGRELKLSASYDSDDTAGVNMVDFPSMPMIKATSTYTTKQRAGVNGQVRLVDPITKNSTPNTSFYPGDPGMLYLYIAANSPDYANTSTFKNPVLWVKIPDSFVLDLPAITTKAPTPLVITSATEVTGTKVPNGYKLYKIKTSGNLVTNAPKNTPNNTGAPIYGNSTIYVPFKVNKFAPPITYDTSLSNTVYYIGSDEQVISGYGMTVVADSFEFQGSPPTNNLVRVESATYNFLQSLNIIGSGFQMFHQIKSDYGGVFKPSYNDGDITTAARFTKTQTTGTLQVQFANNDSQPVDSSNFVYYETLPTGANSTDVKVVLTGSPTFTNVSDITIGGNEFNVLYSTAPNPERNMLTGGTDTSYVDASSIIDWNLVTGFKVVATSNIPGGTTVKMNFPIKILNETSYNTIAVAPASQYRFRATGDPFTSSQLAVSAIDVFGIISGKIFYDSNKSGSIDGSENGVNGVNVELYKVGSPDTLVSTFATRNGGAPLADGYYKFENIDPGTYYIKTTVPDSNIFTTTSVNIGGLKTVNITNDVAEKKIIAKTDSFGLVATNNFADINIGYSIDPKITVPEHIVTNGVSFEKVDDNDKSSQEWLDYFKGLVTITDPSSNEVDLNNLIVDLSSFQLNMVKNGTVGDYTINYIYTNEFGITATASLVAHINDSTPANIVTNPSSVNFVIGVTSPNGTWEDYIKSVFSVIDDQDDSNLANITFDFGAFDESTPGNYVVKANYTDPAGNPSVEANLAVTVNSSTPTIIPKDINLEIDGLVLEKVTDNQSDWEAYFKTLFTVTDAGDPTVTTDNIVFTGIDKFKDNMLIDGINGDYPIGAKITNTFGAEGYFSFTVYIQDETPADLQVTNTELEINQNTQLPSTYNSWKQYIFDAAGITVTDDQDTPVYDYNNEANKNLTINLGSFDVAIPGKYEIKVNYTDLSTLPNPAGNKSDEVIITFTVKGLPVITADNFSIERGTTIADIASYVALTSNASAIDPQNPTDPSGMTAIISDANSINLMVSDDYNVKIKYTNGVGTAEKTIVVTVSDSIKPVITLKPSITIKVNDSVASPENYILSATDTDVSGVVTDLISAVTYKIYDAGGNEVTSISTGQEAVYYIKYTVNDGNGNDSETKTFAVQIQKLIFKVNWYSVSTGEVITKDIEFGSSINEPVAPSRSGYSFGGWYYDSNLTQPVTFPITNVTQSYNMYQKWNSISVIEDDLDDTLPIGDGSGNNGAITEVMDKKIEEVIVENKTSDKKNTGGNLAKNNMTENKKPTVNHSVSQETKAISSSVDTAETNSHTTSHSQQATSENDGELVANDSVSVAAEQNQATTESTATKQTKQTEIAESVIRSQAKLPVGFRIVQVSEDMFDIFDGDIPLGTVKVPKGKSIEDIDILAELIPTSKTNPKTGYDGVPYRISAIMFIIVVNVIFELFRRKDKKTF